MIARPDSKPERRRPLAWTARAAAVALLSAAPMLLAGEDVAIRAVAPVFGLLLFAQLYPLLRPGEIDLFEPPVLTAIQMALATASTMSALALQGTLSLRYLEHLSADET